MSLDREKILSTYEEEGYVIVPNVLDEDLCAEARDHVDWLLEKNPELRPEQLGHFLATKDAFWIRLVSDDRLLDVAELFLGPDLGLFATHYIAKRPGDGKAVPWHQDGSYWPLEPMQVVTFWLALDYCDEDNGCMKVIPRTQHMRLLSKDEYVSQAEDQLFDTAMDPDSIDESRANSIILKPGDIEIHHPNVIHGSHANTSDRWRRGLTIRYIPNSTRITDEQPHPAAFMFRGQGHDNGNGWNKLPSFDVETSMAFADQDLWNSKAAQMNRAYSQFL